MALKIALLGFGTVASGLPFLLEENGDKIRAAFGDDLEIAKILVRDDNEVNRLKENGHSYQFVTSIDDILNDPEIAIVVELMGRIEPAKTYILATLNAGKHVVTANKDLIALHGPEIQESAKAKGLAFYYEAAVAGGIPILRTLANSFTSDKIQRVLGVLNGTSNYMMTKMVDQGWTYEEALSKAQALGYAESDPTNDVEGIDAAYKVAILSQFAFGMTIAFENVSHQGISTITAEDVAVAQELGYVIKLVGRVEETASGILADVSPTFIPKKHPLASVNDVMNAVFVESIGIGQSMFYGPGAGQKPTATSVMADIIRIAHRLEDKTVGKAFNEFSRPTKLANKEDKCSHYYFAIETPDKTGQLLRIATIFNEQKISFRQVLQEKAQEGRARLVIITHMMNQLQLEAVQSQINQESDFKLLNAFKVLGE
ncbi:homoserine dehydrogenase [Streptococcus bovimastitidis]|uniref:Homoserine dehydrogenase n=1 Tax=Streptococcus bovimastitidis TaxID=1856638 RepID=A0A1L8MP93_9STRE|nr:homoserine dehydrogenase [Streptococcus bovimastitidis]OJF72567.1 homoserine dehydrogenase [Streptococcus bovimastitidis]